MFLVKNKLVSVLHQQNSLAVNLNIIISIHYYQYVFLHLMLKTKIKSPASDL